MQTRTVEEAVKPQTSLLRSKRDLGDIFQSVLSFFLSPLQSLVDNVLTNIASFVQGLYINTVPDNEILANLAAFVNDIVSKIAQCILTIEQLIDMGFNILLYGDATGSV